MGKDSTEEKKPAMQRPMPSVLFSAVSQSAENQGKSSKGGRNSPNVYNLSPQSSAPQGAPGSQPSGHQTPGQTPGQPSGNQLPHINTQSLKSYSGLQGHHNVSSPLSTSNVLQRSSQGDQREAAATGNAGAPNTNLSTSVNNGVFNSSGNLLSTSSIPSRPDIHPSQENRARGQSVSFCESESEKSRRFTISAQPSSANLTTVGRNSSIIGITPRKASNNESLLNSSRNGSVTGFPRHDLTDRMDSPTSIDKHGLSHSFVGLDSRYSPSPPLVKSPKFGVQNSSFSTESGSLSNRESRRGSDNPSATVSRNSSVKKSQKALVDSSLNTSAVPFQQYLLKEDDKKFHILLACTGSVATIKVPLIIDKLFQIFGSSKISVQLVVTKSACHFLKGLKIRKDVKIWRDEDEWANFSEFDINCATTTTISTSEQTKKPKTPCENLILHNELRKWADILLIAPLSANTLAKLAHGMSDNLLTSILRCWGSVSGVGTTKKPVLVAPAMNTLMYTHPLTSKHLKILSSNEEGFGFEILKPMEKVLVCGDIGMGGMREWSAIVETLRIRIKDLIVQKNTLEGQALALDERDDEDNEGQTNKDVKNGEAEDDDDEDEDDDDDDEDDDDEDDDEDDDDEDEDDEHEKYRGDTKSVQLANLNEKTNPTKEDMRRKLLAKDTLRDIEGVQRTITPLSAEAQSII